MSAREILTFVMYFPIMVGDIVPENDEIWSFILLLIDILDCILSLEVTEFSITSFKINVENHNKKYIKLFNDTLKPKFHILSHYPEVMKYCGPVRKFWSFHFEAKHRSFKMYTHAITSRRNIPISVAKKYQFLFSDFLLDYSNNNEIICSENNLCECNLKSYISLKIQKPKEVIKTYNTVIFKNIKYKKNYFVATSCSDYKVYKIVNIVVAEKNIFLFCQNIRCINYLTHYSAFEINPNDIGEYKILKVSELVGPPTTLISTFSSKFMLRFKELV